MKSGSSSSRILELVEFTGPQWHNGVCTLCVFCGGVDRTVSSIHNSLESTLYLPDNTTCDHISQVLPLRVAYCKQSNTGGGNGDKLHMAPGLSTHICTHAHVYVHMHTHVIGSWRWGLRWLLFWTAWECGYVLASHSHHSNAIMQVGYWT